MTAEVDLLRQTVTIQLDAFKALMQERADAQARLEVEVERRHQQRWDAHDKALAAALDAQAEAVRVQLTASDKAINKAEAAQTIVNQTQNEWRSTINDLTKGVADRALTDTATQVAGLAEKTDLSINAINNRVTDATVRLSKIETVQTTSHTSLTTVISIVAVLLTMAGVFLDYLNTHANSSQIAAIVAAQAAQAVQDTKK